MGAVFRPKDLARGNRKVIDNAIKDFTQRDMRVAIVNSIENISNNSDWLFWLSEEVMPAYKLKNNSINTKTLIKLIN